MINSRIRGYKKVQGIGRRRRKPTFQLVGLLVMLKFPRSFFAEP